MENAFRKIDLLVIHCAAVPNGRWTTADDIDRWHAQRGFRRSPPTDRAQALNPGLSAIGYHYLIYTNGALATGRHPDEIGAHAIEHRADHRGLGLLLVGTDAFSAAQWATLEETVASLCAQFGIRRQFASQRNGWTGVCGHRDLGARKSCPGFSVADWLRGGCTPLAGHVLETVA